MAAAAILNFKNFNLWSRDWRMLSASLVIFRKTQKKHGQAPVWLSGNALASINVVALRQTRLVLEWVTVCGRVDHFGL